MGGSDERLAEHVEHGAAHEPGRAADADERERGERQRDVAHPVGEPGPAGEEFAVESRAAEGGERAGPVGEDHHQHQSEPIAGNRVQGDGGDGERRVESRARGRLHGAHGEAEDVAQHQRQADQLECRRHRFTQQRPHRPARGDAGAPFAAGEPAQPGHVLDGERPVEIEGVSLGGDLSGCGRGAEQQLHGIARREPQQEEREGHDARHDGEPAHGAAREGGEHRRNLARTSGGR
ncbi:MAG: hypothetical protein AUG79_00405 [Gemmatimonadetes bacterium 13_1_20CM_4_69_16]|nr:MAG: hypothetical protein AUG79_00405 [Gemmatimonadetes bacterium 13_1_20CM_4_69_16]